MYDSGWVGNVLRLFTFYLFLLISELLDICIPSTIRKDQMQSTCVEYVKGRVGLGSNTGTRRRHRTIKKHKWLIEPHHGGHDTYVRTDEARGNRWRD